jgi:formiminoglutamate deiminase
MALSGVTGVGEFHYLHHQAQGRRYADVNAMGEALIRAAADAGIRLTLLDTCYLAGGLSASGPLPIDEVQRRFSDGNAADWAERVSTLRGHTSARDDVRIGGAIHSVRAVPVAELPRVVAGTVGAPLHVHLSEQPAENEQCRAAYGCTPTELLDGAGALGPDSTAVHATHLGDSDIAILGTTGTSISVCPTTERDLADGIGPARQLLRAGSPLTLGTDQHALIDMFEEARALEMHERIATRRRGRFSPQEIVNCLTKDGHRAIGWDDVGAIAVGLRADLVAVGLGSVRTAGTDPGQALLAVGAADVEFVMRDGRLIVTDGHHILGDIGVLLEQEISAIWRDG